MAEPNHRGPNTGLTVNRTRSEAEDSTSNSKMPRTSSKGLEETRSQQVAPERRNSEERIHNDNMAHPMRPPMEAPRTMKVVEAKRTTGVHCSSRMPMMADASDSQGPPGSNTARLILRTLAKAEAIQRRPQKELQTRQATSSTQVGREGTRIIKDSRTHRALRAHNLNSILGRECQQVRWVTLVPMGRALLILRS